MAAAWESPDPVWTSFAGGASGSAWHLDRIRFDAWMLRRIREVGVDVESGTVDAVQGGR